MLTLMLFSINLYIPNKLLASFEKKSGFTLSSNDCTFYKSFWYMFFVKGFIKIYLRRETTYGRYSNVYSDVSLKEKLNFFLATYIQET